MRKLIVIIFLSLSQFLIAQRIEKNILVLKINSLENIRTLKDVLKTGDKDSLYVQFKEVQSGRIDTLLHFNTGGFWEITKSNRIRVEYNNLLVFESNYLSDTLTITNYSLAGNLISITKTAFHDIGYFDGLLVLSETYYSNGQLILSVNPNLKGINHFIVYHKNGKLKEEWYLWNKTFYSGFHREWYEDGTLKLEEKYAEINSLTNRKPMEKRVGVWTTWDSKGQIINQTNYENL